jgi:outer membrane murein-binding lipoprotein Lpp
MPRDDLEAEVHALRDRVDDLEETVESLSKTVEGMQDDVEMAKQTALDADAALTGGQYMASVYAEDNPPLIQQIEQATDGETLRELREDLVDEQKKRSRDDSKLRRRVHAVAEAADVDLEDCDLASGDKIQRLIRDGVDAVTDRPYPVHKRARTVLLHAGEWGTVVNDANGGRIILEAPAVRERLELERNESLQSKQVLDVFEKIVELAADSARVVRTNRRQRTTKLRIQLTREELERA